MKTKKYWQAVDADGENATFCEEKPCLINGNTYVNKQKHYIRGFLFPIPLKPLQIAEITVCENGTWSYEIEREEGWYMARGIEKKKLFNRIEEKEKTLYNEELLRAKKRFHLKLQGEKDWFIESDKHALCRVDYANNGEGFYLALITDEPSHSPYYNVIGYVRTDVAWKFTRSVKYGMCKINSHEGRRYRTWREMEDELRIFCLKNGYIYTIQQPF